MFTDFTSNSGATTILLDYFSSQVFKMTILINNIAIICNHGHLSVLVLQFYLVLLFEDLGQLCVNLLCFLRDLHVAVMNQDEVVVFVTRGRRHLQAQHREGQPQRDTDIGLYKQIKLTNWRVFPSPIKRCLYFWGTEALPMLLLSTTVSFGHNFTKISQLSCCT